MRILIADDDFISRQLLKVILTTAGHEVLDVSDGQRAWELLQSEFIPFVITDWIMPELDGITLIQRIRAARFPGYTYIILVTSRDDKADVVAGLQSGADDYLTKPFEPDELQARIAIGERILTLEANLRQARDQLHFQATHDQLTGLLNRPAIVEHAAGELVRSHRTSQPLSLILLDIDHFKSFNDQHGHLVGDQILQLVCTTITQVTRPYDKVGRWGGEEVLIVLPDASLAVASVVGERVRSTIATTSLTTDDGSRLSCTVSLGICSTSVTGSEEISLDDMFQRTDEALYRAKNAGRNRASMCTDT